MQSVNLVLTTYPGHLSRNVGDNLITASTVQLIRNRFHDYDPMILFRDRSLDQERGKWFNTIVAPGFSVRDGTYPKLIGLYTNLNKLENFFPVGCSFQHISPSLAAFENYQYSDQTLSFFRTITKRFGPLPCRDQLIVDLLHRHDIPALYSGDLAIYDEGKIGADINAPDKIRSLVFTVQHRNRYIEQSQALLRLIKEALPSADLYVAHHSIPDETATTVAAFAKSIGFSELNLSGDVQNLDIYDNIDFHIGYRLHGHISFLRRRKPSILLVEDARSYGFANTSGTSIGCFPAATPDGRQVDNETPRRAVEYMTEQLAIGFSDYSDLFSHVDRSYHSFVKPYFDDLAKQCPLKSPDTPSKLWRRIKRVLTPGR